MAVSHGSLPFKEQIDYFRRKTNIPTRSWTDIYAGEHDNAFAVAGASKRQLLEDLRSAVERSINDGTTLEQFRQDFDGIVEAHGWQYNGGRGWRTNVIYETNLRQSYNAGRREQMSDPELRKRRPYGLYRHGDSRQPRPDHLAWDGLVLPLDDPWWDTHDPQNGWGCTCKKFMLSERDVKRMGLTVSRAPHVEYVEQEVGKNSPNGPRKVRVPKGIDPGFESSPGQNRLGPHMPQQRTRDLLPDPGASRTSIDTNAVPNRTPHDPLPAPRETAASQLLPDNLTDNEYAERFLEQFGASLTRDAVFKDVVGDDVTVGRKLFSRSKDDSLKISKRTRAPNMLLLADAIKQPDEVWVRIEWHNALNRAVVRRRYLAQFLIEGVEVPLLAVFDLGADGWDGVTGFSADAIGYLESMRNGVRLYQRQQ
ncbi:hypothetical protein R84981_001715 [Carnimonas sp. R-84981]|uniref:PBECR2 nuclease fold domain-containing protein n=1 Tax=Carnimonas bestiolae TaxID=3402172 RepID=UPI003EDC55BE